MLIYWLFVYYLATILCNVYLIIIPREPYIAATIYWQYIGNICNICNILLPEANIAIYTVCLRRILRYCNIFYSEATIYCSIYCSYYLLYGLIIGLIFEEVEIFVSASLAMKLREYTRNTPFRRNSLSKF